MKLLYAYVNNFRGMSDREFVFDDEFRISLDRNARSLNIEKNDDYKRIRGYYGNNVSDIMLILGDNGSGKTSILELLTYPISYLDGTNKNTIFFSVYLMDNGVFYIKDETDYFGGSPLKTGNNSFETVIDRGLGANSKDTNLTGSKESMCNLLLDNHNQLDYFGSLSEKSPLSSAVRKVRKEHLFKLINGDKLPECLPSFFKNLCFKLRITYLGIPDVRKKPFFLYNGKYRDTISYRPSPKGFTFKQSFIICILEQSILKRLSLLSSKKKAELYEQMVKLTSFNDWLFDECFFESYEKRKDYLFEVLEMVLPGQKTALQNFIAELETIKNNSFEAPYSLDLRGIDANLSYLFSTLDNNVINSEEAALYRVVSFDFGKFSSGELALLRRMASLIAVLDEMPQRNVCVLLDEPDAWLHMEWQRNIIDYLVESVNSLRKRINCSFIITTHSPYLVTDIFSNKIILANSSEDETFSECGLLSNLSNIAADGFFVKYPVGEYAKNKLLYYRGLLHEKETIDDNALLFINSICDEGIRKLLLFDLPDDKRQLVLERLKKTNKDTSND